MESADPDTYADHDDDVPASLADVMLVSELLLESSAGDSLDFAAHPSCAKLGVNEEVAAELMLAYREKLKTMQQSLA